MIVPFTIVPIPDTTGLRIKSDNPTGVYVSSVDAFAAKSHFETMLIGLVSELKLIVPPEGGGWILVGPVAWDAALAAGKGSLVIRTTSPIETRAYMKEGTPSFGPPGRQLPTNWWQMGRMGDGTSGQRIGIACDDSQKVDPWITDNLFADLRKKTH